MPGSGLAPCGPRHGPRKGRSLARQLALPFEVRPAFGRSAFIVAPPNESAVHFIDRWPEWPVRAAALHGPAGCGKTHLTEVFRAVSGAERIAASALTPGWVAALAADAAAIVEDIDRSPPSRARDEALMMVFERSSGTLLLTGRTRPETWPVVLGDVSSRYAALLGFAMWAPDDALLAALARKLFADRQMAVSDAVVTRMLTALERTPAAVSAFVSEVDRASLAARRPVSARLVSELLDARGRS